MSDAVAAAAAAPTIKVSVRWSGKEYTLELGSEDTVEGLKRALEAETAVQPKRQKLLGLKTWAGKPAADDTRLVELALKAGAKVMMMG